MSGSAGDGSVTRARTADLTPETPSQFPRNLGKRRVATRKIPLQGGGQTEGSGSILVPGWAGVLEFSAGLLNI